MTTNSTDVIISLIVRSNPQNCVPKNLGTLLKMWVIVGTLGNVPKSQIWEHLKGMLQTRVVFNKMERDRELRRSQKAAAQAAAASDSVEPEK